VQDLKLTKPQQISLKALFLKIVRLQCKLNFLKYIYSKKECSNLDEQEIYNDIDKLGSNEIKKMKHAYQTNKVLKQQIERQKKAHKIEKQEFVRELKRKVKKLINEKINQAMETFKKELFHTMTEYTKATTSLKEKDAEIKRILKRTEKQEKLITSLSTYINKYRIEEERNYEKLKRLSLVQRMPDSPCDLGSLQDESLTNSRQQSRSSTPIRQHHTSPYLNQIKLALCKTNKNINIINNIDAIHTQNELNYHEAKNLIHSTNPKKSYDARNRGAGKRSKDQMRRNKHKLSADEIDTQILNRLNAINHINYAGTYVQLNLNDLTRATEHSLVEQYHNVLQKATQQIASLQNEVKSLKFILELSGRHESSRIETVNELEHHKKELESKLSKLLLKFKKEVDAHKAKSDREKNAVIIEYEEFVFCFILS
jgi:hypothetical protein